MRRTELILTDKHMKIAIPTRDGYVDDHFGHCAYFTIMEIDGNGNVQSSERLDSPQGCGCKSGVASILREKGVEVLIAGNMGQGAVNKLAEQSISVVRGCHGKIEDVAKQFALGELKDNMEVCDHHDCHHHEGEGHSVLMM